MEIDETVKRLNAVSQSAGAYGYKNEKKILVTWSTFTVLIVPYEAKTMFDCHFVNPNLELPADVKAQLSGIIGKFLRTPIRERFPEKKYRLRWIDNGYWWNEKVTGLPIPSQEINRFGDIPLVTWSTYVYPPKAEDWIEELNASFNSPMQAYEWLAPRLEKYANEDS